MKLSTIILTACIAIGFMFLSSLGFWQLNRLSWKQGLIARVESNLTSKPLEFDEMEARRVAGEDIEYRPVTVTGEFDHSKEQHYFATFGGRPGYFVYTPLKRDNGQFVFVNRGYVPLEKKDANLRQSGLIDGRVTINGLARSAPSEKPNSFVPNNDLEKNIYYWKSLSQMLGRAYDKTEINSARFFVDADKTPVPGNEPRGGVTRITFPNSHLQYALTWFGLAITLLVVGGYFLFTRAKAAR